jgi:rhodanese-related sulfurtransferase
MHSVSPADAADAYRRGALFVDVRLGTQHARDGLPGSRNLPLALIQADRLPEDLPTDQPVYLLCERGHISELAGLYLEEAGFRHVANVRGGLGALRPLL